jgi:uncharacterized membrane protein
VTTLEQSIDVNVPAKVAWDQLHRMDSYPQFIEGLQSARKQDPEHVRLQINANGGPQIKCETEIIDSRPNELMKFRIMNGGPKLAGTVELRPLDDRHTKVHVQLEYDPQEITRSFGLSSPKQESAIKSTLKNDLEMFKALVERASKKGSKV